MRSPFAAPLTHPPRPGTWSPDGRSGIEAPRRPRSPLVAPLAASAVLLTGCSGAHPHAAPSAPAGSPSPSPSAVATPTEQEQLLAQYRTFWKDLAPVSRLPAAQRQAKLSKVAVDPALRSLLAGMAAADAKGQVLYGENIPRPSAKISPDDGTALVDDCQNSSAAGVATRATLSPVTVGTARNHVVVTMKKSPDGVWKVAFVSYTKTPC